MSLLRNHRFLGAVFLLCQWMTWGLVENAPAATALPAVQPPAEPNSFLQFPTNSPVSFFRRLLTLPPDQQINELASRPAASRAILERKLTEYRALSSSEREARFQAIEFHYYLERLVLAPTALRSAWLAAVPVEYRSLCQERLRLWSILPAQLQQYMLERKATLRWLTRLEGTTAEQREDLFRGIPPAQRQAIEQDFAHWQAMTPQQREQNWSSTRRMFELSAQDQARVFTQIAATQRPQTEKLLQNLRPLTHEQRQRYMDGLRKFSQLSPDQRARFIQGWERWKTMSEPEREVWRRMAAQLPLLPSVPPPSKLPSEPKTGALSQSGHGLAMMR